MAGLAAVCTLWPISGFDRWVSKQLAVDTAGKADAHRSRIYFTVVGGHRISGESSRLLWDKVELRRLFTSARSRGPAVVLSFGS